MYAQTFRGYL